MPWPANRYAGTLALDALTLDVPAGAVFGILGPNGSPRTPPLRLLTGFALPPLVKPPSGG